MHLYSESTVCRHQTPSSTTASALEICFPAVVTSGITRGSETIASPHLFLFQVAVNALTSVTLKGAYGATWTSRLSSVNFTNNYVVVTSDSTGMLTYRGTVRPLSTRAQELQMTIFAEYGHISMWILPAAIVGIAAVAVYIALSLISCCWGLVNGKVKAKRS